MLFTKRAYINKRDGSQMLRTATEQTLPLDGLILPNLRLNDLNPRVWFGIDPLLAIEILLGTVSLNDSYGVSFRRSKKS